VIDAAFIASGALIVTEAVELAPAASATFTVVVPGAVAAVNRPLESMVPPPGTTE
jgi:hypothetical protein